MEEKSEKQTSCIYGGKKIAVLFAVGVLLILVALTCYPLVDSLIQNKIDSTLELKPGSDSFKQWRSPNVSIYLQFFIFHVDNYKEASLGSPPHVVQKGPYSYKEYRRKENITWHDENSTVSYNERQWFVFDPETSCAKCDPAKDVIVNVNIPLITIASIVKNFPDYLKWKFLLSLILEEFNETLFEEKTVQELLWGYNDPILEKYSNLRKKYHLSFLPDINPLIALQKNDTFQGFTTIHTGVKDINLITKWTEWKGRPDVGVWNTTYANMFNGSDGTQFPPQQSTDSTLYVFVTQLCRSLYLTYNKHKAVKGIDTLQFTTPKELYLNASINPDNRAFCTKECYPTGILDVGVCQDAPISLPLFVSAPHFYLGDKSLTKNVKGLSPNEKDHGTFLDVEPHLGIPLKSSKRLQINALIEPVKDIEQTEKLHKLFLPVFFINETATIDNSQAQMIKDKVLMPFKVVHGVEIGLVVLGGVLILIGLVFLVLLINRNRKLKQVKTMLSNPNENSPLMVNT